MQQPLTRRALPLWIFIAVSSMNSIAAPAIPEGYVLIPGDETYAERREALLRHYARGGGSVYDQLARLALDLEIDEKPFLDAFEFIDARHDCADFRLHPVLRFLYQYTGKTGISDDLTSRARETVLNFKYWPDEPGIDSMCTWSENHHILFAAGGYLAGQLFPDAIFTNNGDTGREKMAAHRTRIMRWLDLRYKAGFCEWLSNVYYPEDIAALINLVDFCQDEEIAQRAAMVMDLLLADIVFNSYRGLFGCSHGRTYEGHKKFALRESTSGVSYLITGMGNQRGGGMGAASLVLSERYRAPRVLTEIAHDYDREVMLNRQRMSIRSEDAKKWGLAFDNAEDGMVWLSMEAYTHPQMIPLLIDMFDQFNWWQNRFFEPFAPYRGFLKFCRQYGLLPVVAKIFESDLTRNMRDEVNVYTYRTPDYMLSTAQDWRRGFGGDQQHIWQASLAPDAVCFTTHPVRPARMSARSAGRTPNLWDGSGNLPRAAQLENVAIVIYHISTRTGLYITHDLLYTHAWLPKEQFDEIVEAEGWVFARRGDGYLALRSQQPAHWQEEPGPDQQRCLIAPGRRNIWICELGRRATDGEFSEFQKRILDAPLHFESLQVSYESPSQGRLEFDWNGPLKKNGQTVPLGDYPRYDNPYTQTAFPADSVTFRHNDHWLELDWTNLRREASEWLDLP